ncbi:MAG: type II toxin-antitoxin system HicA family toxin [Acidobacteriota bacterium]
MTYRELARKLRTLGCTLKRHTKGSHEIWHSPARVRSTSLPNHPGDIPRGTLKAVLKQLQIAQEDLDRA